MERATFLGCGASPTDHVGNFFLHENNKRDIIKKGLMTSNTIRPNKKVLLRPASQLVRPLIYEQDHYIRLSKKGQ